MPRIAVLLEYSGKAFHGSQLQLGVRTVQSELESALRVLARKQVRLTLSGRTDTGVHASGQVAHFDWDDENVDLGRLSNSLNGIIKRDLAVRGIQWVPDTFHARFSANAREYVYRILNHPCRSALLKDTHYFVPQPLNLNAMTDGASRLLGRHDFSSFRSSNADTTSTICSVTKADLLNLGEGRLEFRIAANRFVYNMVRIIVGTLVEIGLNKKGPESMSVALAGLNRDFAGPTAPPWGLTLTSVRYPGEYDLFETSSNGD